jgi:hypothetical protein
MCDVHTNFGGALIELFVLTRTLEEYICLVDFV